MTIINQNKSLRSWDLKVGEIKMKRALVKIKKKKKNYTYG